MVFGNAVAVPASDLAVIAVVAALCLAVHGLFAKELAFTSFDAETAQAVGMRVRLWDALLFLTIGLAIPPTARASGALPVFAFLTLPAAGALLAASLPGGLRPRGRARRHRGGRRVRALVDLGDPDRRDDGRARGGARRARGDPAAVGVSD